MATSELNGERVLRSLRVAAPERELDFVSGVRLAERQAALLRGWLDIEGPAFPTSAFYRLPFLTIRRLPGLPVSGACTDLSASHFAILVRADETLERRRFTKAHEIKHAVDHRDIDRLYGSPDELDFSVRIERTCDRFAAALLMPAARVRHDWHDGHRDVRALSERYQVSRGAMERRLRELGLRSRPSDHGARARSLSSARSDAGFALDLGHTADGADVDQTNTTGECL